MGYSDEEVDHFRREMFANPALWGKMVLFCAYVPRPGNKYENRMYWFHDYPGKELQMTLAQKRPGDPVSIAQKYCQNFCLLFRNRQRTSKRLKRLLRRRNRGH